MLASNNPKVAQAMPLVRQIMNSGGSKKEQLIKACQISGMNADQVESTLKQMGININ